jgi:cytochrome b561
VQLMAEADGDGAVRGYSLTQIVLHWVIAALVVVQLLFNDPIQEAFDNQLEGVPTNELGGALVHVTVGLTILLLAIVRLAIRVTRGAPPVHKDTPLILRGVSYLVHALLYLFIFGMPVTGAIAWFGGLELSAEFHEIGRLVLIPLIGFHALGAFGEHFVFRNDTLLRMLRPERNLTKL